MILLDTNLLCRMTDSNDPQCAPARQAVHRLMGNGEQLIVVPQNLFEFWAVATRKPGPPPNGQNGLGMTPDRAGRWLAFFRRRFTLLLDNSRLFDRWVVLVASRGICGFKAHDARLAAAVETHRLNGLLTFNGRDFHDMGITVIDPATV